jgi:hypothetical protein
VLEGHALSWPSPGGPRSVVAEGICPSRTRRSASLHLHPPWRATLRRGRYVEGHALSWPSPGGPRSVVAEGICPSRTRRSASLHPHSYDKNFRKSAVQAKQGLKNCVRVLRVPRGRRATCRVGMPSCAGLAGRLFRWRKLRKLVSQGSVRPGLRENGSRGPSARAARILKKFFTLQLQARCGLTAMLAGKRPGNHLRNRPSSGTFQGGVGPRAARQQRRCTAWPLAVPATGSPLAVDPSR